MKGKPFNVWGGAEKCAWTWAWHEIYIHHITDTIRLSLAGGEINDHLWCWMLWLEFNMPLQLDTLILHFTKFSNLHWNYITLNWYSCSLKRFSKTLGIFFLFSNLFPIFPFQEPDLYRGRGKNSLLSISMNYAAHDYAN